MLSIGAFNALLKTIEEPPGLFFNFQSDNPTVGKFNKILNLKPLGLSFFGRCRYGCYLIVYQQGIDSDCVGRTLIYIDLAKEKRYADSVNLYLRLHRKIKVSLHSAINDGHTERTAKTEMVADSLREQDIHITIQKKNSKILYGPIWHWKPGILQGTLQMGQCFCSGQK